MNDLLHEALNYVQRGWSVIPLEPQDKTPYRELLPYIFEHGRLKPTWAQFQRIPASEIRVRNWWGEKPNANIGLVTGQASGFFVLDCDTAQAAHNVRARGLPINTVAVGTKCGIHFYFALPEFPIHNRVKFQPGMDIRGEGGYVVAPPSKHPSGGIYWWLTSNRSPLPAPEWLLDILHPHATQYRAPADRYLHIKHGDRYARAAFNGEYLLVVNAPEGKRNDTLNRACYNLGQLVGDGLLDRSEVETALLSAALSIGQNEREARATIASGVGDGMANPRSTRPYVAQRK